MSRTDASRTPPLVVVGTVAFDDVETPVGRRDGVLGGSATYFSVAASYFTRVGLVGVVGEDFPAEHRQLLLRHQVDLSGLEAAPGGRTFHWAGRYTGTMNEAETLATDLNVLESFAPRLPANLAAAPFVFLANTDPRIQGDVLDQLVAPHWVVMDTMNLWIEIARERLLQVLARVDGAIFNDREARDLSGCTTLPAAGRWLLEHGPRHFVVVKKGEHGSFLFTRERLFALPAYPLESLVDPTGAGDSFAGGFMGRLAASANRSTTRVRPNAAALAEAMLVGTTMASFTVSDFSLDRLAHLLPEQIEARIEELRRFVAMPV